MHHLPETVRRIVEHFDALPGIGPKHAARLALHLVKDKERARNFSQDLDAALASITFCNQCQTITDRARCDICADPHRNQKIICVVAHVQDVDPIERTGKHTGVYHILHGTINPIEGVTPDVIKIKELVSRIRADGIEEIILALDATQEGEATALYLKKVLAEFPLTATKLARGIPVGADIEYTDEVTLSQALENRKKI